LAIGAFLKNIRKNGLFYWEKLWIFCVGDVSKIEKLEKVGEN